MESAIDTDAADLWYLKPAYSMAQFVPIRRP